MATTIKALTVRIEVRALTKRFSRQPVLNQLSLTINEGDVCVLVGDNGAGKTTLLRLLAGLARPSQGDVSLCGLSPAQNPHLRRLIGYVGHQHMAYQDLTPHENLRHTARLYQLDHSEARVSQALHAFGLRTYQDQPVRTLSRGMQQRLSLARATLHNPDILLLDEPYTGLDQQAACFLDETLGQWRGPGRIILLAAHRPQRLLPIVSHVAWLREGSIQTHIRIEALPEQPELRDYLQEAA